MSGLDSILQTLSHGRDRSPSGTICVLVMEDHARPHRH